jgi:glycerol uptake operon antiterminator
MGNQLLSGLHINPIIAAIHHEDALDEALNSQVEIVFLLTSTILSLEETVNRVKATGKKVFVHADLVEGLSRDLMGLKFICDVTKPDGIITTKTHLIKACKKMNVMAIQRIFLLDSHNFESGVKSVYDCSPDAVEILPGIMPTMTSQFVSLTKKPIITGGLITTKDDIIQSLKAGASGISTSKREIWND